jgi:hypothetical protein
MHVNLVDMEYLADGIQMRSHWTRMGLIQWLVSLRDLDIQTTGENGIRQEVKIGLMHGTIYVIFLEASNYDFFLGYFNYSHIFAFYVLILMCVSYKDLKNNLPREIQVCWRTCTFIECVMHQHSSLKSNSQDTDPNISEYNNFIQMTPVSTTIFFLPQIE